MADSILTSVKKNLGIAEEYEVFDPDILLYINGAFATLNQLGLGPEDGFSIENKTTEWVDFIGPDARLHSIKTLVILMVKKVFDPPTTSYLIESMDKQIQELQWRLNVVREEDAWIDPNLELSP